MNVYRDSVIPFTQFGGLTMSSEFPNFNGEENWLTIFAGEGGFADQTSMPDGNYPPVTWKMPLKAGAISSRYNINGSSILVYNAVMGYPASVNMPGSGIINSAEGSLLAFLVADLIGSGDLDGSTVGGLLMILGLSGYGDLISDLTDGITRENILADLTSQGLLSAAIAGGKNATSDFTGIANLEAALGALAGAICGIISNAELNGIPSAKGHIGAAITPFTELSPQALAASLWNSIADTFNAPGTMGQKLNSAAVGGVDYEDLADSVWSAGDRQLTAGTKDAEIESILDLVTIIRKLTGHKVTKSGDIITIYEEDGVTTWRQYNLAGGGRQQL